jgi:hypothetical protein
MLVHDTDVIGWEGPGALLKLKSSSIAQLTELDSSSSIYSRSISDVGHKAAIKLAIKLAGSS